MSVPSKGSYSPMMREGRQISMEGAIMDEVNKGAVKGNEVIRICTNSKATVLMSLALATTSAGMAQSFGQEVSGFMGIVGGIASIGGGCIGAVSAGGQLNDLRNIGNVEDDLEAVAAREAGAAEGDIAVEMERLGGAPDPVDDAASPLSDADKEIAKEEIKQKWRNMDMLANLLGAGGGATLFQGFSQLAQSPFTAIQAREQAKAQVCQGVSEMTSNLIGGNESLVQTLQGTFGSVGQMPSQSLQWAAILAQAH